MKPGGYLTESAHRGAGRLQVRALPNGNKIFYFRFVSNSESGKRDSLPIGYYDPKGITGLTLVQARNKVGELSRQHQAGKIKIRASLATEVFGPRSDDRHSEVSENANNSKNISIGRTLGDILEGYIEYQYKSKKYDAANVDRTIRRNIIDPFPDLCARNAASLCTQDLLPIIQPLTDNNTFGMAHKTRGYLCAAFSRAMKSDFDTTAPQLLRNSGITMNPALQLATFSDHAGVGERNLEPHELSLYLKKIRLIQNPNVRGALLLAVYLGGQRMAQLLRAKVIDINLKGEEIVDEQGHSLIVKVICIYDPKGKRTKARLHKLPLFGETERIVLELLKSNTGCVYVFCDSNGKKLDPDAVSRVTSDISSSLIADKQISTAFNFRDLRRTCETLLAKLKISKDIRAQILSHGLGGIQDKHYDRHDYLPEKYDALRKWTVRIEEICTNH